MQRSTANGLIFLVACVIVGYGSAALGADSQADASATPRLARTIPLPGVGVPKTTNDGAGIPGRLDHLAYDPATGRLFIAALQQGSLEVVDLNKGERIKRIEGLKKPQGIAVVGTARCLVVACGNENAVHVYSLADFAERAVTPIGQNADNVRCDGTNRVYIGFGPNEGRGGLAIYDAAALKKTGEIKLAARPESFRLDLRPGVNDLFVNLPGQKRATNDGSVARVDRLTGRTLATWPLHDAAQNFPMAFDSKHDRVYIASRKPAQLICLDSTTGKVESQVPCVADSDDLYYDAATDRVLVIGGGHRTGESTPAGAQPGDDAAIDVFQSNGEGKLSKIASAPTSPHARTGYFVAERRAVYVVCPPHGGNDAKVLEFTFGK